MCSLGISFLCTYITLSHTDFNDNENAMDGTAIGVIRVVVGTTAVFIITIVVVASILICICVQSSKRKCMFK